MSINSFVKTIKLIKISGKLEQKGNCKNKTKPNWRETGVLDKRKAYDGIGKFFEGWIK